MSKVLVDRELLESVLANWNHISTADWDALKACTDQPAEAEGDRIANGFVILDGMAFSRDEILTQRIALCDALDTAEKLTAERDAFREARNCLVEENTLLYEQIANLIEERDHLRATLSIQE